MRRPPRSGCDGVMRPLWMTMIFWTSARPRPVPLAFVVKNGWNMRSRAAGRDAGTVVGNRDERLPVIAIDPHLDMDGGHDPMLGAGFDRVAAQIAEGLTQQHFVALDAHARTGEVERTAARRDFRAHVVHRALQHGTQIDHFHRDVDGTREVQEIRHDFAERVRFLLDALDARCDRVRTARRGRSAARSRESSPGCCGTRARCRRSSRRPGRGSRAGATALRAAPPCSDP